MRHDCTTILTLDTQQILGAALRFGWHRILSVVGVCITALIPHSYSLYTILTLTGISQNFRSSICSKQCNVPGATAPKAGIMSRIVQPSPTLPNKMQSGTYKRHVISWWQAKFREHRD